MSSFRQHRTHPILLAGALASVLVAAPAFALAGPTPCTDLPHADHPKATISQGPATAVFFLPDAANGYYRASRFDWSGVLPCLSYKGHTFFGEWFPHYDPMLNDAITGPVEEFRGEDGALGYDQARPGEPFVKLGVGVLRRIDDTPYKFGITYPLLDGGKWTTETHADSITFTQELKNPTGVAYRYRKIVRLERNGSVLALEHSLTNLGKQPIDTGVYDHDFFMLDGRTTGTGMRIHFAFPPHTVPPPSGPAEGALAPAAAIEGNDVVYKQMLAPHQTVSSYLGGYSQKASDFDITVSDTAGGLSVRETGDQPISKLYLWSIPTTVAPEAYIHLNIAPGATAHWTLHYEFRAP